MGSRSVGSRFTARSVRPGIRQRPQQPDLQVRLREFLNESFSQTSRLVEHAKAEGQVDAELNTAAIVLLIQAVGIGVHMIRSSGLDEAHLPPTSDWVELNGRLSEAAQPRQSQ